MNVKFSSIQWVVLKAKITGTAWRHNWQLKYMVLWSFSSGNLGLLLMVCSKKIKVLLIFKIFLNTQLLLKQSTPLWTPRSLWIKQWIPLFHNILQNIYSGQQISNPLGAWIMQHKPWKSETKYNYPQFCNRS